MMDLDLYVECKATRKDFESCARVTLPIPSVLLILFLVRSGTTPIRMAWASDGRTGWDIHEGN